MKVTPLTLVSIILAGILVSSMFFVGITASVSSYSAPPGEYDPWCDLDDDGDIDIFDIVDIAGRYGTTGENMTKASVEYDSGWVDITKQAGQYFSITHSLNSTDIMVDIQGKTTSEGGVHQRHLGLTSYTPGWWRTYGGADEDRAYSLIQTDDGGYAIAGYTKSYGAGDFDFWLVKTSPCGEMQWNQTYGWPGQDQAYSVIQTADGGYALTGRTWYGVGPSQNLWLVKTDANGVQQWNQTYGGTGPDEGWAVIQTEDGGFAVAGLTYGGAGLADFWLVKTDANGVMQWNQSYGGTGQDEARSVIQTEDGGYMILGSKHVSTGNWDMWLFKTNATGYEQWNRTYGGGQEEFGQSLVQTLDGGYALGGFTYSFGAGYSDFWLVRINSTGHEQWSKTYGDGDYDDAHSLILTSEGGFALAGLSGGGAEATKDGWIVKTDENGNQQWNKTYGGVNADGTLSIVQTDDGGYAVAGRTSSFGSGNFDFWLVKTEFESGLAWTGSTSNTITLYRGATDIYWNYMRVRVWKIKNP